MPVLRRWRVATLLFTTATLAMPAAAQTSDATYCAQLAGLVERYLSTGTMGAGRGRTPKTLWAIEQCNTGNTAEAIPVLEMALRDNRFTLPRR